MAEYNPDEARKVLEGSLEERIIAYADLKCGKGAEVAAELRKGNYRENHEDPIQTLDKVCGKPEIIDAEFESIDGVVEYQHKPNIAKVALKGTVDLINKTCWYYPFVGALPGKYQQKIADRLGDKAVHYGSANLIVELTALFTLSALSWSVSGAGFGRTMCLLLFNTIYAISRGSLLGMMSEDGGEITSVGSPLLTIPYYAPLGIIQACKITKNALKKNYLQRYEKEQKLLEQKSIDAEFTVRKVSETKNTPARIEEPEPDFAEELDAGMNPEEMPTTRKYLHKE